MKIITTPQLVTEEIRNRCACGEQEFGSIVYRHIFQSLETQIQKHFPMTYEQKDGGREYKVEFVAMSMDDFKKLQKLIGQLPYSKWQQDVINLLNK